MSGTRFLATGRAAAVLAAIAALPVGVRVLQPWPPPPSRGAAPAEAFVGVGASRVDSLDEVLIARDPFRASRRPAAVPFDPNPAPPVPAEPPPPKPALAITGIVWGGQPSAVLEGLPGAEGARLVRVGEVIAGFRIRRITAREVTVTGMDTTWVLAVRKPW